MLIKPWTLPDKFSNTVEKLLQDKLILVFHNHVLKQFEECKRLCKFTMPFTTKTYQSAVEYYFCKLSARSSNNL